MSSRVLAQTAALKWGIQGVWRLISSLKGWRIYAKAHVMGFIKCNAYFLFDSTAWRKIRLEKQVETQRTATPGWYARQFKFSFVVESHRSF